MSLRENSCFSLCPFLNKDLRLPRQRRLRQAPNATGAASEGHKLQRRFSFLPYFFFSPTFPIVFSSCAVAEQSVLCREIPTRSDRSAAARSPPPLQPLSRSASHTHFNLKSQPEVPGVLKSLLLWHPPSPGLSPLHSCSIPGDRHGSPSWTGDTGKGRTGKGFQHSLGPSLVSPSPSCPAAGSASLTSRVSQGKQSCSQCLQLPPRISTTNCSQPLAEHAGP